MTYRENIAPLISCRESEDLPSKSFSMSRFIRYIRRENFASCKTGLKGAAIFARDTYWPSVYEQYFKDLNMKTMLVLKITMFFVRKQSPFSNLVIISL
jgi:hypothetical protein